MHFHRWEKSWHGVWQERWCRRCGLIEKRLCGVGRLGSPFGGWEYSGRTAALEEE